MKTEAEQNEEGDVVYNLLSAFQLPTQLGVDSGKTTFARISRESRLNKKLSAHDKGLMGTANQMFAQNKIDEAVSLSLEIIRTCPGAAEPYQLLSEVLHEKGFQEHGYKMSLFAAHLDSSTPAERWIALADDSTRILGETEEVTKLRIACYRNAYNKTHDGFIKWKIGDLYCSLKLWSAALQAYKMSLRYFPGEQGTEALNKARRFARQIYAICRSLSDEESSMRMKTDALAMLLGTITSYEEQVSDEDINYAADLLLDLERYQECEDLMEKYCGFEDFCPPDERRFDLTSKMGLCMIAMDDEGDRCQSYLRSFINENEDIEKYGDLWFRVAEMYLAAFQKFGEENNRMQYLENALRLTSRLLHTEEWAHLLVLVRHADILESLGHHSEAIEALKHLAESSEEHRIPARARIMKLEEKISMAVMPLEDDQPLDILNFFYDLESAKKVKVDFVFEQMKKWTDMVDEQTEKHEKKRYLRCVADLGLFIMTHGFRISFEPDRVCLFKCSEIGAGLPQNHPGRYILVDMKNNPDRIFPKSGAEKIEAELEDVRLAWLGWYRLFREVLGVLLEIGRFKEAILLAEQALKVRIDTASRQTEHSYRKEMQSIVLAISMANKQYDRCYKQLTEWIRKSLKDDNLASEHHWNLFNYTINNSIDVRHQKFIVRQRFNSKAADPTLWTMLGHVTRETRSYYHAADSYNEALKLKPDCPFLHLNLATIYTHIASQRFTTNRHSAATQVIAFLSSYTKLRGIDKFPQEIHFNRARILHQLGMYGLAAIEYKKVISSPVTLPTDDDDAEKFDLTKEAAFNLSLIYRQSGNKDLAFAIVSKYCRI